VAWGKTTGYAETLIEQGVESTRAQQLENWQNQREVVRARQDHRYMTDEFDRISVDEDWRNLSSFGVARNQNFDLDQTFGPVIADPYKIHGTIELSGRMNRNEVYEFQLSNSFMGFSDFRAAFTPETSSEWTVSPSEGSLSGRKDTDFLVKYRPQSIGLSEGYLVIDTEEYKWTWKLKGMGTM
jgi:hypothetical protein